MEPVVTAEEVRRCADLVKPGECITFPNGLTVDKRLVAWPPPVVMPGSVPPQNPPLPYRVGP